jgi:hypothetical protein
MRETRCYDTNLAAAEHYMFARCVAQSGILYPGVNLAVWLLAAKKEILSMLGIHFGKCPETPDSFSQIWWGQRGALDGLEDFANAVGGPQAQGGPRGTGPPM